MTWSSELAKTAPLERAAPGEELPVSAAGSLGQSFFELPAFTDIGRAGLSPGGHEEQTLGFFGLLNGFPVEGSLWPKIRGGEGSLC